jgi:hypothetical protein
MAIQPESLDCQIKRGLSASYPITPLQQQAAKERLLQAAAAQIGLAAPASRKDQLSGFVTDLLSTFARWSDAQDDWERTLRLRLSSGQHQDRLRYVMSGRFMSIPAIV